MSSLKCRVERMYFLSFHPGLYNYGMNLSSRFNEAQIRNRGLVLMRIPMEREIRHS